MVDLTPEGWWAKGNQRLAIGDVVPVLGHSMDGVD